MDIPKLPISIAGIILANLWVIIGIVFLGWDSWSVAYLYWAESAVIGLFNIPKMLLAQSGESSANDDLLKRILFSGFFCVHFGGFMLVHLALLSAAQMMFLGISGAAPVAADWTILTAVLMMFASHGLSFFTNYWQGGEYKRAQLGLVMFTPYPRIVLMQLVVVLGMPFMIFIPGAAGVLLVMGKTVFDVIGHLIERRLLRPSAVRSKT